MSLTVVLDGLCLFPWHSSNSSDLPNESNWRKFSKRYVNAQPIKINSLKIMILRSNTYKTRRHAGQKNIIAYKPVSNSLHKRSAFITLLTYETCHLTSIRLYRQQNKNTPNQSGCFYRIKTLFIETGTRSTGRSFQGSRASA